MRRISLWALSTMTTLVLLIGYHTSTSATLSAGPGADQAVISASGRPAATGATVASGGRTTRTVTGVASDTRYGPVQVQLTLEVATLTDVAVVQYPAGNHENEQINGYALPILVEETIAAQSAQTDMVSGATYTSAGYAESLQSALDQAGL